MFHNDRWQLVFKDFEPYTHMVELANAMDVETSMGNHTWSTEEFQQVLAIHTEQIRRMKSMCRAQRMGFIHVLSQQFCESCLPFPEKVVQAICDRLPKIALERNESLLTIIKVHANCISFFIFTYVFLAGSFKET
jgi:hypothetical protein